MPNALLVVVHGRPFAAHLQGVHDVTDREARLSKLRRCTILDTSDVQ